MGFASQRQRKSETALLVRTGVIMNSTVPKQDSIVCEHVSKTFIQKGTQQVPVLSDISLSVKDHEFLVVLGPGQSGKSTLLRIIAGLETPSEGRVLLNGKEITGPGPDRGMVFQSYMLFAWKTVLSNVKSGLELGGYSSSDCHDIAMRYLDLVGLKDFADYYPHQLSGGMKQRVGIARAYATNPAVMLLDEPFGQLDAQTRVFMEHETVRIWEAEKRTMVFVTNNIDEALFLGDRIVSLEGKLPGRLKTEYVVDLPRPRDHTGNNFLELRQSIINGSELIL